MQFPLFMLKYLNLFSFDSASTGMLRDMKGKKDTQIQPVENGVAGANMETLHTYPEDEIPSPECLDVDREHLKMIEIADELHEGLRNGENEQVLARKYNNLVEYSRKHFAEEERIMLECSYPEYWQHKQEHECLMQRVMDIQDRIYKGNTEFSIELVYLLKHWFTHHVFGADRSYDHFIHGEAA